MFFHAALLFDNEGFSREAMPLARAVEEDDLEPLYQRALDIAAKYTPETFFLGTYGAPWSLPKPIEEVKASRFRSSEIGIWFMLVMSEYLQPLESGIGYEWKALEYTVRINGWEDVDIDKLIQGLPAGLLVSPHADSHRVPVVEHSHPYWRWIRPMQSYGHGGWLPCSECKRLRTKLEPVGAQLEPSPLDDQLSQQERALKESCWRGYNNALALLSQALENDKGTCSPCGGARIERGVKEGKRGADKDGRSGYTREHGRVAAG